MKLPNAILNFKIPALLTGLPKSKTFSTQRITERLDFLSQKSVHFSFYIKRWRY